MIELYRAFGMFRMLRLEPHRALPALGVADYKQASRRELVEEGGRRSLARSRSTAFSPSSLIHVVRASSVSERVMWPSRVSRVPAGRTGGRVLGRDVPRVRTGAGVGVDACLRIRWTSEERTSGTGDMPVSAVCPAAQECARRYDLDVRYANRRGAGRGISRTRKL